MEILEIEEQLADILSRSQDWIPEAQLAELHELNRAGEPGVALEIFCTQLSDLEVALPKDLWEQLRRLSREMGIDEKYCEWVAPKVLER